MEIGTHISKSKAFYPTLTNFFDDLENKNRPVQIFTGSPKFGDDQNYKNKMSKILKN